MNHADASATGSFHGLEQNAAKTGNADGGGRRNRIKLLNRGNWAPSRLRAVIWRSLTLLTCPCCIPIWIALLSGTAAGALLGKNIFLTVALFLVLFVFCFWKALRSYDPKSDSSPEGERDEPH